MHATIEIVYTFQMHHRQVEIVYVEYAGGGECWEYNIFENGTKVHTSANRYGSPEAAARDGFGWIVDNGY